MGYTVFISHSSEDGPVVDFIASQLRVHGLTPIIAQNERPRKFPEYLPDKIEKLIQESDCVVALLTQNGVDSNWVNQEVGYTLDRRPLIPIVESGVPSESLAFLQGAEYIPLHRGDVSRSVAKLVSWTTNIKVEKEKSENIKMLAVVIMGVLFLWLLSQSG